MLDGFVLEPTHTYGLLAAALTLHLLHHRLAKRHIGFAEVFRRASCSCLRPHLRPSF